MTDNPVRVWDPLVRLFHWSLVAAFVTAYFTGDEESEVHIYAGYFILGLLVFRIVWGLVGTRHARFSDFLYSPRRTLQYLKSLRAGKPEHYLGHNPAGGWMVILLLVSLSLATWTGLQAYGQEGHGPLAGGGEVTLIAPAMADEDGDERAGHEGRHEGSEGDEEFWEELHEFFANLTVFLVVIHIAGVVVTGRMHRENLVRAMITGDKPAA